MTDSCASTALLDSLSRAAAYPHAAGAIEVLETHISWVFLTGEYAYKVKKPVKLGFADFSSLESRRRACEDELRLNRRLAPALYLDVVEIRATSEGLRVGGAGPVIEYAVRMRRFPQDSLASRLLAAGTLTPELVTAFARGIAQFHESLPAASADSACGQTQTFLGNAFGNFDEIAPLLEDARDHYELAALRDWTEREAYKTATRMHARRANGRVRECHGDLHLANIVKIDGALVPFDCIEFSAALRWNDVFSEAAFVVMDLAHRGAPRLAWLFLNAYLEATGDCSGVPVLRFYVVYRAMVRAKIHLIRARQPGVDPTERARLTEIYRSHTRLAAAWARDGAGAIVLMHGFSGSGKSTIAARLAPALGAIRVRSDVERKRLAGADALSHGGARLYASPITHATYERIAQAAREIAGAGYPSIVDATFLRRAERARFRNLARELGVPLVIVDVTAPGAVLRERVASRALHGRDASDATLSVLEAQIATAEPLTEGELADVVRVDGREGCTARLATALHNHLPDRNRKWQRSPSASTTSRASLPTA
jgi:aminoglycoside phosphotransferase family enzyme/predicted kinase